VCRRAEADERVDRERRPERRLAVLARQADVRVAVLRLTGAVEEPVQDLVLPGAEDDRRPAIRADGVPAEVLDETARLAATVNPRGTCRASVRALAAS
jgi:hypothetical protein